MPLDEFITEVMHILETQPDTTKICVARAKRRRVAAGCFGETVSQPAWRRKPSWYVIGEHDKMIPPAAERYLAARMQAKILVLSSRRGPMLSQPEAVADFIMQAVASFAV